MTNVRPNKITTMHRRLRESGATLIWVILLTGFMAFVALAFLSSSSIQNNAARLSQSDTLAAELTQTAEQEVLAKLHEGFSVEKAGSYTGHVAAAPGLLEVRRYDVPWNRGSQTGAAAFTGTKDSPAPFSQPFSAAYNGQPANPRYLPLFSWRAFAPRLKNLTVTGGTATDLNPDYNPELSFNINTARNPFHPGACLLSGVPEEAETIIRERVGTEWSSMNFRIGTGQTSAERPVWVQWIPILKDPTLPASAQNPIVGRYAYWVDVENSKVNVSDYLHDLRDQPEYARLVGEPDSQDGGSQPYEQSDGSTFRSMRLALESDLPAPGGSGTRSGGSQPGYAPAAASEARTAWLGDSTGTTIRPPLAARTNVLDWSYFCAPWQRGYGDLSVISDLQVRFREWQSRPQEKPLHPWFVRQPRPADESALKRAQAQLLTQVTTSSLTSLGHEEDLDPLGRPKLNLIEFQNAVTGSGSSTVSLGAIQSHPLWSRLTDTAYAPCYFPGLIPMKGTARSFADSFNRFAGTGAAAGTSNGQAALLQLLTNIAEARQPDSVAPVIDKTLGIVGARSMPYVAEVATRVRSAMWLLPEAKRAQAVLLATNPNTSYKFTHKVRGTSRHARWFATSVEVDVILALVNPNPFETEPFEGKIEVDLEWAPNAPTPTSGADYFVGGRGTRGTATATVSGHYTGTPEQAKDAKDVLMMGNCVRIPVAVLPGTVLADNAHGTCLRILGWRIYRGNSLWHEVPVRHPGTTTAEGNQVRSFWQMTQNHNGVNANLGAVSDAWSFQGYASGGRAAGWITEATARAAPPNHLFVSGWTSNTQTSVVVDGQTVPLSQAVNLWHEQARKNHLIERIICLDPVLGHRTGADGPASLLGSRPFYGMLGPSWRYCPSGSGFRTDTRTDQRQEYAGWQPGTPGSSTRSVQVRRAQNGRLIRGSQSVPVSTTSLSIATQVGLSGSASSSPSLPPAGLTGAFRDITIEGKPDPSFVAGADLNDILIPAWYAAPQGSLGFNDDEFQKTVGKRVIPLPAATANGDSEIEGADLEPAAIIDVPAVDKAFTKQPELKKGPRGFFCSAPPKRAFVTVGEIGFVHSGFPNTPVMVGPDEGRTYYHLNSPVNGPPMRMILDVLTTPRLTGGGTQTTSTHAWNVNTLIAHDDYMALRQGGDTFYELKKERNPATQPLRAVWSPNAQSYARRETGADGFLGNDAEALVKKDPGHLQDRHVRPCITIARPWNMWMGVLAGDFSPQRAGDSISWGAGNRAGLYFGPAIMTWRPGLGSGAGEKAYVDFQSHLPGHGRLLALGEDGRKDDKNENLDYLKGRHAADQNLAALDANLPVYLPAHFATRLSLVPMRHFISDLAVDFHQNNHESDWLRLKTALNPGLGGQTPPGPNGDEEQAKHLAGAGFPGGHHQTGVFYNAPMALMTTQAGVSANAFSAYIVVQSVRDRGKKREGISNSGPGHCDPDDEVLAERWSRILINKVPVSGQAPRFQIIFRDVAGR